MPPYITRIAPSPTGMFHLGTARTAYFNYLAAKSSNGKFLLRIDDTDENRNIPQAIDIILDSLSWLKLDYFQIFYQSKRKEIYISFIEKLLKNKKAYILNNAVILNSPDLPNEYYDNTIGKITISQTDKNHLNPLVLLRSNNSPTYNFASVCDDYLMNINYIIRGVDHIQNTPKQMVIWKSLFTKPFPKTSHIGLIFKDKKKLSKRDNASSLLWYKENNYNSDAILNFLLRMGWGPKIDDKSMKIINKEKAIDLFLSHGSMRSAPSNFDQSKLDFYNRYYSKLKES